MNNIPKLFWYAVSICMLTLTGVISSFVLTASYLSVKWENAEIEINKEKNKINESAVQTLKIKNELKSINDVLAQKEAFLKTYENKIVKGKENHSTAKELTEISKALERNADFYTIPHKQFEQIDTRLEQISPDFMIIEEK